jgi:hypothetical protein
MTETNNTTYSLSNLADSLINASKIAKELGIEISRNGVWRKVIISNTLGHELSSDPDDPLLDATKDGVNYAYLAAHYGKRAQMWLSRKSNVKKDHTFIIAFFSDYDSSKIFSIWSCKASVIWKEVSQQASRKASKSKTKSKPKDQLAYFSEAWLRTKKGKGSELIFKSENI